MVQGVLVHEAHVAGANLRLRGGSSLQNVYGFSGWPKRFRGHDLKLCYTVHIAGHDIHMLLPAAGPQRK
jgi:hypothetical protein